MTFDKSLYLWGRLRLTTARHLAPNLVMKHSLVSRRRIHKTFSTILLHVVVQNCKFWCILGGASVLYVATAQESEAEEEGRERALVKDGILH